VREKAGEPVSPEHVATIDLRIDEAMNMAGPLVMSGGGGAGRTV
jgi:hypothetical protein